MDERYSRQIAYFGKKSQKGLRKSKICIAGCGALGSCSAELLARAGVGTIKLIDRDFVELSNLQRQHLFTENDINMPKPMASAEHLKKINSATRLIPVFDDFNFENAENLIRKHDLVLDGLDNMESRFILNEACVKNKIPWIFASSIKAYGNVSFINPEKNCLNCFIEKLPIGLETCESVGVLNSATTLAGSVQASEAIRFLTTGKSDLESKLFCFDLKNTEFKIFDIEKNESCRVCVKKEFEFLEGKLRASYSSQLCGMKSYHIRPSKQIQLDLNEIKTRIPKNFRTIARNDYLIRAKSGKNEFTIFKDGRAIIKNVGKNDSKKIYRKLVLI